MNSLASLRLERHAIESLNRQERKMGIHPNSSVIIERHHRLMGIRDEILDITEEIGSPIKVKGLAKNGANQSDNVPVYFKSVDDAEYFIENDESGWWEYYIDV